ncbi:hypothetical protein V8C44DRAFT_315117 [Trichoderma aethiopicum]
MVRFLSPLSFLFPLRLRALHAYVESFAFLLLFYPCLLSDFFARTFVAALTLFWKTHSHGSRHSKFTAPSASTPVPRLKPRIGDAALQVTVLTNLPLPT